MKTFLPALGLALVMALALARALAQDPPQSAPAAAPEPAAEASQPATPPATEAEESLPPLPAGTRPTGPTPQRFDPTEKVRADFPVSFPIDI